MSEEKDITVQVDSFDNLKIILEKFRAKGLNDKQIGDIVIELDWSNCYYESDRPGIVFVYKQANKKKKR